MLEDPSGKANLTINIISILNTYYNVYIETTYELYTPKSKRLFLSPTETLKAEKR